MPLSENHSFGILVALQRPQPKSRLLGLLVYAAASHNFVRERETIGKNNIYFLMRVYLSNKNILMYHFNTYSSTYDSMYIYLFIKTLRHTS